MELVRGQIVASTAGRDTGRLYVVLGVERNRVLLANGTKWILGAPKSKNLRHVNPTLTVLQSAGIRTDGDIQRALADYEKSRGGPQQGG